MARYLVRHSYVDVVGHIWMPSVSCSMRYPVRPSDVDNMRDDDGQLTRESVEQWLCNGHSGDFQAVTDFRASIEDGDTTVDIPFATEDGETAYYDTLSEDAE